MAVPGPASRQPVLPATISHRLARIGIDTVTGRASALLQLAGELPPTVVADLLGLRPKTAIAWGQLAGPGPPTQPCAARSHSRIMGRKAQPQPGFRVPVIRLVHRAGHPARHRSRPLRSDSRAKVFAAAIVTFHEFGPLFFRAEDGRGDCADAFGVGDRVDLGDFAVGDGEAHHGEWLCRRTVTALPGPTVHQYWVQPARVRAGASASIPYRLLGDRGRAADQHRGFRVSGRRVDPQHDGGVEHGDEGAEVTAAGGGEEGVQRPLAGG